MLNLSLNLYFKPCPRFYRSEGHTFDEVSAQWIHNVKILKDAKMCDPMHFITNFDRDNCIAEDAVHWELYAWRPCILFFFLSRFASMRKDSIDVIVRNEYYKLQSTVGIRPKKIVLCFKNLLRHTKSTDLYQCLKLALKLIWTWWWNPKYQLKQDFIHGGIYWVF